MIIFIAQPIKGIPADEIGAVRTGILNTLQDRYGDNMVTLHLPDIYRDSDQSDIEYLGNQIKKLQGIDCAVFAPGWPDDPMCQVYWTICNIYGIKSVEFDSEFL